MQLDHVVGLEAGYLMQIVDVLGDDRGDLAGLVERGQRPVPAAGLRRGKGRLHRKAPPPGFVPRLGTCDEFVERDRAIAGPQPARRAEVGNTAFGRNAGAGEGNDTGCLGDHVAEALRRRCEDPVRSLQDIRRFKTDYSTAEPVGSRRRPPTVPSVPRLFGQIDLCHWNLPFGQRATSSARALSTAIALLTDDHNPATLLPN